MIKRLIVASVLLIVGYIVGVRAGFKTAVNDYVNNDAQLIERYASQSSEEQEIPEAVREKIEEAEASTAKRGFQ